MSSVKTAALFWVYSLLAVLFVGMLLNGVTPVSFVTLRNTLITSVTPLFISGIVIYILQNGVRNRAYGIPYVLFFAISLTSLLGMTQVLTGSHAEVSNPFLYGLSFYTASLAYLLRQKNIDSTTQFIVSSPLVLFTGPIAVFFGSIRHRSFRNRFHYYAPFVILGLFLHQAIATPLTQTFHLISETDVLASITFAAIFELFVYANFCGLSLMVYGVAGILGFKIPLNFKQPFSSKNIIEFWRGWHTSLSMVLKSLFFTPTRSRFGVSVAIFSVFLASAMWHGVTLNFVIWGLFHASMFVLTIHVLRRRIKILPVLLLVIAVVIGRMLFADADSDRLIEKLHFSFTDFSILLKLLHMPGESKLALFLISAFVLSEFFLQRNKYFSGRNYKFYRLPIVQLLLFALTLISVSSGDGIDYAVYGQR